MKTMTQVKFSFKETLHYGFLLFISIALLILFRSFISTEYMVLKSNLSKIELNKIQQLLDAEKIPYRVSFNFKKIKIPNYEYGRIHSKLSEFISMETSTQRNQGGY